MSTILELEGTRSVTDSDKAAYAQLLSRLADLEPRSGWAVATDLPELSRADVALVCRMRAVEVGDHIEVGALIEDAACGRNPAVRVPTFLEAACRKAILYDVEDECERRAEFDRVYESRSCESPEAAHGVAHLFRDSHLG